MSQRSALTAAAMATADVSDPPRPRVVTRPLSDTPWKPGSTAISPDAIAAAIASASMLDTRALAWASAVWIGTCQPSHERALQPMPCSVSARSPLVTCSPLATTTSYSAGSKSGLASRQKLISRSVSPAIADTTTATSWPAACCLRTMFATRRMRSVPAIEVPPNFITMRAKEMRSCWYRLRGAVRGGACPMQLSQL